VCVRERERKRECVCVCRGWRRTQIEKKIDGERERESVCKRESERVKKNTTRL